MSERLAKLVTVLKPKRQWVQFSLTKLFVLVALAAVPCDWLSWMMEAKRRERRAVAEIERFGGGVLYDWQSDRMRILANFDDAENDAPGPRWVRRLLGDDFFANVRNVSGLDDIADAQVVHLEVFTKLNSLDLHGIHLTDAGLEHIKGLKRLESLSLCDSGVTDAGLRHLKGMALLKKLNLSDTQVTDVGLVELQGLTRLEWLFLLNTSVTDVGVAELQKALPNCNIWLQSGAQYQPVGAK